MPSRALPAAPAIPATQAAPAIPATQAVAATQAFPAIPAASALPALPVAWPLRGMHIPADTGHSGPSELSIDCAWRTNPAIGQPSPLELCIPRKIRADTSVAGARTCI